MIMRILTGLCLLLFIGCSSSDVPPLGQVSGTILINGNPQKDIAVTFSPVDGGRQSSGATDENGKYSLVYSPTELGALVGKHTVKISANDVYSDDDTDLKKPKSTINPEYLKVEKEQEVKAGNNEINLTYP